MTHIETLKFELEALRQVLISQTSTMLAHATIYEREVSAGRLSELQAKCSRATFREYRDDQIPRTERHIKALEYILRRYEELTQ
jgi:hypothetical protein